MYTEVGTVDDETIVILEELLEEAEWHHWDQDKDYHTFHIKPDDVDEIIPVLAPCFQQFFIKMEPGGYVHRHVDARKGVTYHVPVSTNKDCYCFMFPENEPAHGYHLEVGKIYEVDRDVPHSSQNNGDSDRIHLLVEVAHAVRFPEGPVT
jgi:hypothetical protein